MTSLHLTSTQENSASGTVTVACKMPNGLVLRLFRMVKREELVLGGGVKEYEIGQETGDPRVFIHGPAYAPGDIPKTMIYNGYALTPNVPEAFWNEWLEQNRDTELVRNKLIFAQYRNDDLLAATRENEERKTGLEELDPQNLPARVKKYDPRDNAL